MNTKKTIGTNNHPATLMVTSPPKGILWLRAAFTPRNARRHEFRWRSFHSYDVRSFVASPYQLRRNTYKSSKRLATCCCNNIAQNTYRSVELVSEFAQVWSRVERPSTVSWILGGNSSRKANVCMNVQIYEYRQLLISDF